MMKARILILLLTIGGTLSSGTTVATVTEIVANPLMVFVLIASAVIVSNPRTPGGIKKSSSVSTLVRNEENRVVSPAVIAPLKFTFSCVRPKRSVA